MEQEKIMEAEAPTVRVGATQPDKRRPHGWGGATRTNGAPTPITPQDFLQAGCPSCRPTNSIKALKAQKSAREQIYQQHEMPWSGRQKWQIVQTAALDTFLQLASSEVNNMSAVPALL